MGGLAPRMERKGKMNDCSGERAYVNWILIAANVLFFLYLELAGSSEDIYFMYTKGAMFAPAVLEEKEYYRLITAMFMHFGIHHIVNNMLVLFVMGEQLEKLLGHVKYLIFYLACGVGSNWLSMIQKAADSGIVSAGASGAIFGVIGGLLYAVIVNKGTLGELSTRQLAVMILFSLYFGYTSTGVDQAAHISGLLLGVLFGIVFYRRTRK